MGRSEFVDLTTIVKLLESFIFFLMIVLLHLVLFPSQLKISLVKNKMFFFLLILKCPQKVLPPAKESSRIINLNLKN